MKADHRRWWALLAAAGLWVQATPAPAQENHGAFVGRVIAEWLEPPQGDSRTMRLLEEFAYRDPQGRVWKVPPGALIDGASIPASLWSPIGSPYTGRYRRASVVHDYFCDKKTASWRAVHRMFYNAMRAGGVPELKAKAMFGAVYQFGPRWTSLSGLGLENGGTQSVALHPRFSSADPAELSDWIETSDPTLEEIERRVDSLEERRD